MKKFLAVVALLAVLVGCLPALATSYMVFPTGPVTIQPSPSATPTTWLYVQLKRDSAVYKKAGSGKTNVIIQKGSTLLADARSKDKKWVRIYYGEKNKDVGWLPFKLLRKAPYDYPIINYASSSGGKGTRIDLDAGAAKLAGTRFKVRVTTKVYKSGSSKSKAVGRLKKGLSVRATGKLKVDASGMFFVQITYKGKTGWVPEASLKGASSAINRALLK